MQDFPANSQKAKETIGPREPIERVTSAETVRRKKGLGRQFKETFIVGDARSSMEYVIFHVLIPSAKDMMFDAVESGLQRYFFGEGAKPRRGGGPPGYSGLGRVNYSGMSQSTNPKPSQPRMLSRSSRARHDFDDLIIPSRQEAEEVIDRLFDILSRDGMVTVAHLYELTGIQSSHTDMKWGWTELRGAKAARLRQGGFLLDLPEPEPLS
jgi:hypothetical protein